MKCGRAWTCGVLATVAGAVIVVACESTGDPPPKVWTLGVNSATYSVVSPTVVVSVPEGQGGDLEFKDKNGQPVDPPSHLDGGVTIEIRVPIGAVAYDWKTKPKQQKAFDAGAFPASAPLPSAGGLLSQGTPFGRGLSEFTMGCMTATFDPGAVSYAYALHAVGESEDQADALMKAVLYGKVGSAVNPAVTVDAFLELTIQNNRLQMVSSMPAEFADYAVTLDGNVVANLASGLNADVVHGDNGWISIVSNLPLTVVQPGSVLQLVQRAVGATQDVTLMIQ